MANKPISKFFEENLGAPFRNILWSWGAVSSDGQVFLRVWGDERLPRADKDDPDRVYVLQPGLGGSVLGRALIIEGAGQNPVATALGQYPGRNGRPLVVDNGRQPLGVGLVPQTGRQNIPRVRIEGRHFRLTDQPARMPESDGLGSGHCDAITIHGYRDRDTAGLDHDCFDLFPVQRGSRLLFETL